MDYPKFSVLMSVYYKERPEYLKTSIESIINQTIPPSEIVLVEDGQLTNELYDTINSITHDYPDLFTIVPLSKNMGLGYALSEGILHCSNEIIARMDSDDISLNNRFERQLCEFMKNEKLDVCGSHISEFDGNPENIVGIRKVPLIDEEIKQYQKRRDGVNHVTVMMKKSAVLKAGNYQSALLMEDSLLWVNMIKSGAIFMNIDDILVNVRADCDMIKRRGGIGYYKKYKSGRKRIYETGYISYWDYVYTLIVQFCVCIIPTKLREFVFRKLLRNAKSD